MGIRIDDKMDGMERDLFRKRYDELKGKDPSNDMLRAVTVTDEGIFAEQSLFDRYGFDVKTAIPKFYMGLIIACSSS